MCVVIHALHIFGDIDVVVILAILARLFFNKI